MDWSCNNPLSNRRLALELVLDLFLDLLRLLLEERAQYIDLNLNLVKLV